MVTVVATNAPFSLIGEIRGIFGQSSDILQLDAIGFYTNTSLPLSSYRKTNIVGEKMEMTSTTSNSCIQQLGRETSQGHKYGRQLR